MSGRLSGRTALVTGAGRGIGRAVALKFAAEGANLVINDLDEDAAEEVVEAVRAAGTEAIVCAGNISATEFPSRFVDSAVNAFGGIDIIVNNAGYTWDAVIHKMTDDQWARILDVHLAAPFRILRAAQPVIGRLSNAERETGKGRIRKVINVSSVAGLFGNAGQANYSAAKAGIIGLTQTLAKEWGRYDVTVNCVAFGLIGTRLVGDVADNRTMAVDGEEIRIGVNSDVLESMERNIPLGRIGTPEEAAGAIFLFAIPESDYVSGQTLLCSGGLMGM